MLEVIGAGYGRTGTLSLKVALERLGFGPCHHAVEMMRHPEQLDRWSGVREPDVDWNAVYAGYRSTTDFPGAAFWRELSDAFPAAKVILTVRDPHRWYASVTETFLASGGAAGTERLVADAGHPPDEAAEFGAGVQELMGDFADQLANEETAVAAFEQHTADVRAHIAPERLLVFEVGEGWEPLCAFLGVEVPDEPFPKLNEAAAFDELIPRLIAEEETRG